MGFSNKNTVGKWIKNALRINETLFNGPLYIKLEKHEFRPARKINTFPRETFSGVFIFFLHFSDVDFEEKSPSIPSILVEEAIWVRGWKKRKTSSEGWKSEIFAKLLNASVWTGGKYSQGKQYCARKAI